MAVKLFSLHQEEQWCFNSNMKKYKKQNDKIITKQKAKSKATPNMSIEWVCHKPCIYNLSSDNF